MLGLYRFQVLVQIMTKERSILQTDVLPSVLFLSIHETDEYMGKLHPRTPISSLWFKVVYTSVTHHITHCVLCSLSVTGKPGGGGNRTPVHHGLSLL